MSRHELLVASLALLVVTGCSAGDDVSDDERALNRAVSVCVGGPRQGTDVGSVALVQLVSGERVLDSAEVEVPGEVVLRTPADASDTRLMVDGELWGGSPVGGGWGIARGTGCATPLSGPR